MPEFIRTVNPSNGTYENVLININHIVRIYTASNPDILQVVPVSDNTYTGYYYVFSEDLMNLVSIRNLKLLEEITEKQNP